MWSPSWRVALVGAAAITASLAAPARAEVQVTMRDGKVSIIAKDATLPQILAEWGRVGQTKIVNGDKAPGGPLTLQLTNVSEEQALDVLLRALSGYVAAPRAMPNTGLSRYDRIAARFSKEATEARSFLKSGIATGNAKFNRMIEEIEHVAVQSRDPVLLMGPTGAGKSQLARRIYELKKARHQITGAFVEVNCATLRGDAAMSALFGHVKGAFTGALKDRAGLLRAADGGLLFLDEVGELGLDEARHRVGRATGREGHDDLDLAFGPIGALRAGDGGGGKNGSAGQHGAATRNRHRTLPAESFR